jgi:RimJ/RimL family protein N-acetyltransferase
LWSEQREDAVVRYHKARMVVNHPVLIDLPMPIRTPRLLFRPRQLGDGVFALAAIRETWDDLHKWMSWAEDLDGFTSEGIDMRYRQAAGNLLQQDTLELLGIEVAIGEPVVWCGLHDIDWRAARCDTGFWVRKSAQGKNIATESANAMLRYAFGALGMRRVGITHSEGNEASRHIAQKLGFQYEGVQRAANALPGGRRADRHCYVRFSTEGLPPLEVHWGEE